MKTPWSRNIYRLDKMWRKPGCRFYRKTIRDKIVELMKPNEKLLDVGCGSGILYEYLPPEIRRNYIGVDFTPEFIELCKKRYPEGNWKIEDVRNLSFPDNSFYLVNSTTVLQHILEWKDAAKEFVRVSKKYVISTCRTHNMRTQIVAKKPVLRRRFNPQDIINFYSQYGNVTWQWVRNTDGKKLLGMYILIKEHNMGEV